MVLGKELVVCVILLPFTRFRVLMCSFCRWGGGREGRLPGLFPLCCLSLSRFYSHHLRSILWQQQGTGIICLHSWAPLHIKHGLTRSCHLVRGQINAFYSLWASLLAHVVKNLPTRETWVRFLGWEDPLEKGMATHSSILAWTVPWTEEPGGLWSMWWQRVGHDWSTKHSTWSSMDTHFPIVHVRGTCFPWAWK